LVGLTAAVPQEWKMSWVRKAVAVVMVGGALMCTALAEDPNIPTVVDVGPYVSSAITKLAAVIMVVLGGCFGVMLVKGGWKWAGRIFK